MDRMQEPAQRQGRWGERRRRQVVVAGPIIGAVIAGGAVGIAVHSVRAAVWWTAVLAPVAVLCAIFAGALAESLVTSEPPRWDWLLTRTSQVVLAATALVAAAVSAAGFLGIATVVGILGTATAVVVGRSSIGPHDGTASTH
jgi:4-amino-4-deoxy-L-arabinose transferase-like glycosyltransferase